MSDDDGVPEVVAYGLRVTTFDGQSTEPLAIIDHKLQDFGLLAISGKIGDYPVATVSPSLPRIGDGVFAMGHPLGLTYTFSDGLVSSLRDLSENRTLPFRAIQTNTAVSPGNSGGPLIDSSGQVVGVNTFVVNGGQALNFALSTLDIMRDVNTDSALFDQFPFGDTAQLQSYLTQLNSPSN